MNLNDLVGLSLNQIFANIGAAAGPLTGVIALLVFTALADVATGIYAAVVSGTFNVAFLDSFLADHVAKRWAPIIGTLLGGIMIGGVDNILGSTLIAAASAQIVAYEASTFGGSIAGNFKAASTKSKGLPGQSNLLPLTAMEIGQTEVPPHSHDALVEPPVAPPPPPPPPLTVVVDGQVVAAHRDENGKVVIDA